MIVPDINLLVYAYDRESPSHAKASRWWDDLLYGNETVGMPWAVTAGFIRIITNPRILASPLPPLEAVEHVEDWLSRPHIMPIDPGPAHLRYFRQNIEAAGVGGDTVPDAHLAAMAMEHNAELHTYDRGFARFTGLKWRNPLVNG